MIKLRLLLNLHEKKRVTGKDYNAGESEGGSRKRGKSRDEME